MLHTQTSDSPLVHIINRVGLAGGILDAVGGLLLAGKDAAVLALMNTVNKIPSEAVKPVNIVPAVAMLATGFVITGFFGYWLGREHQTQQSGQPPQE